jgi:hypothetical protein
VATGEQDVQREPSQHAADGTRAGYRCRPAFRHRDDGTVKSITVRQRCIDCGILGAVVDRKNMIRPDMHRLLSVIPAVAGRVTSPARAAAPSKGARR